MVHMLFLKSIVAIYWLFLAIYTSFEYELWILIVIVPLQGTFIKILGVLFKENKVSGVD